jgi:hypothetical protein
MWRIANEGWHCLMRSVLRHIVNKRVDFDANALSFVSGLA